jgi:hypothetical protein
MPSSALHPLLRARTNVALAALWLVLLAGVSFEVGRVPWLMVALGVSGGIAQGTLQRRAIVEGRAKLVVARTSRDIRAALVATRSGNMQIVILWVAGGAFVLAAYLQGVTSPFTAVLVAILAQWLVRETLSVGALVALERSLTARSPVRGSAEGGESFAKEGQDPAG